MVRLSSRLTVVVKFVNPLIGVVGPLIIYFILTTPFRTPPPNLILIPFLLLIPVVACWPHIMVQKVYFNDRDLLFSNFLSKRVINLNSILEIHSYGKYFYTIKYDDGRKRGRIYFFPRIMETFMNSSPEPKSVMELKNYLKGVRNE